MTKTRTESEPLAPVPPDPSAKTRAVKATEQESLPRTPVEKFRKKVLRWPCEVSRLTGGFLEGPAKVVACDESEAIQRAIIQHPQLGRDMPKARFQVKGLPPLAERLVQGEKVTAENKAAQAEAMAGA